MATIPCIDSFKKLGLKSGKVPNHALSSSSQWDAKHHARYGRLNTPNRPGLHIGAWAAKTNEPGEWIQVTLVKPTKVTGVITQGRNGLDPGQWVTRYNIMYMGPFDNEWKTVQDSTGEKDELFHGNSDRDTKVINVFHEPVVAVKLRLVAQEWKGHISLRHEYLMSTCDL